MRWKSMFITIVLNIFIMLSATILFEYINLSERFVSIEDTIQEALDSSIEASVGSEELFSAQYQSKLSSFGSTRTNDTSEVRTLLWVDSEEKFYKVNTYLLAYYYSRNGGRLPQSEADVNVLNSYGLSSGVLNGQTGFIYEWLYGEQKSDYRDLSLRWANRSPSRLLEYRDASTGGRNNVVNDNFRNFYNSVGKYQRTAGYLKHREGTTNSFKLGVEVYPTLMNMGYDFMSDSVSEDYTKTSSGITHDNFTSTYHIGKAINGQFNTYYYLTPTSLGVTYIPIEVLKPVFITNLDTVTRLNYIGGASTSGHTGSNIKDASHCVETSVYEDGSTHKEHTKSSNSEDIVTDGLVEFDLSTVKVKVDYFYINFSSAVTSLSDRQVVVSKINGAIQSYNAAGEAQNRGSDCRADTLNAFIDADNDTFSLVNNFGSQNIVDAYQDVRNGRIIARVSVRVKVHVPYQSSMLQWMCEKFSPNNHHYDIKLWDESTDESDVNSDGIWYQYTTYYCTTRN